MKSPLLFRRLFSLAFVFLASICQTRAVHIYLDTVSATPASQVVVTVRAAAFTQILSMQGTISWDPSVATFFAMESYGLPSMGIGNFGTSNTTNLNNGKLTFSWDDAGGTGITVPNGAPLFSIRFVTAAVAGTSTAVSLTGSPTPIEFIDLNLNTVQVTSQPGLIQVQSLTPPNDSCLHAIPIACGDTLAGSTLHATTDIAPTCDDAFNTSPGVWYAFTGDGGITTVSLCHSSTTYNSALSVFRGSCGNLICVAGNDNNCASLASEVTFDSDPGEVYLIFVHGGLNNPQGDFVISISCSYEANDACSQAIEITCGQALSGSTLGATNDTAPLCTTDAAAPGVWYYFIGNGQQATVSTCSSNTFYDTKILVYEGDCNTLLCVSGNDDDNLCNVMSTLSTVTFATDSGTVYFILVSGYNGETGEFDLSLTCEEPLPQECASPGKGISDTLVATLDTLPISGYTGFIRDLNVSVHIVHDYTGDLTIDLISPMGTIVKVYDQACGDPLMLVTYDDEGVINTCNTSPPNVQPSPGTLSDFDGENPNGIWIIRVVDNEPQDDGVLVKWCLQITTGECGIPSNCDDADACTMEECVEGICHYTSLDCDDGSLCTIDDCDPLQGCVYTSINCDDQNACTLDACDSLLGCVYTPVNCDDQNACTIDNCNPLTGCVNTPIPCADANPCTIDTCIGGTCFNIPKNCDDASLCTQDFCVDGACLYIPINCDDQNACTLDACDSLLGCVYTPVNCDDQNACTLDACDPLLGCVYTPVNCDDQNACTLDACDSLLGCVYTPVNCDDQNACTLDACDSLLGCLYTPVNCDDQNACTLDACDSLLGCVYTPVDCDDNNPCTIDKCEEGICTYSDVRCDDGNPCTLDFCDNQGNCVFALLNCDDDNACTVDGCLDGECFHQPVVCDPDADLCTIEICDSLLGCISVPRDCDDGNACTADNCMDNNCIHPPVNCDDQNACTLDACDSLLGCVYTPVNCDDQNACTLDACDPLLGCVYTPVNCDDQNACTLDACDPLLGCVYTPVNCDDQNACTLDACDSLLGCVYTPVNCDDQNACTLDACDSLLGCVYTPVNCDDQNACTLDACDSLLGCVYTPVNCDDQNACTVDACDSLLGCVYTPVNCDDQNACTVDACDSLLGCVYTPVDCDDQNACTVDACDPLLGCVYTPVNCDDQNACTLDACDPLLGCVYTPVNCDDQNACTLDACDSLLGCVYTPVNCDDQNACTLDACDSLLGCVYTPVNCDDQNACTVDACDSLLGCVYTPVNCDDQNACTVDACDSLLGCVYTPVNCDDQNACTVDACDSLLGCVYTPVDCDDQNACTVDACDPLLGCVYTPVDCDDQNACTVDACDSLLGCVYTPVNCDDQNACTLDACDSLLGCVYTPVNCDDQNACTLDACDSLLGCVYTSVICEDNNPCTIDKCEEGTCINTSIVCNDGDPCTIDTCVGGQCIFIPVTCDDHNPCTLDSCGPNGCVHTPLVCDDQNACTDDYCDQSGNCVFTARNCDDGDSCTMDLCDPLTGCFYEIIPGCGDPCDGVICDDNQICTIDFCDNGVCVHVCDTNYAHELQWQKSLGGSGDDKAKAVHQTHDGGYIVAGYARSNNGDVSGNHGQSDYWITRLDGAGNLLWAYTYGGSKSESANAIRQTVDGGFIVAGNSKSNDGDVSGNHGGEDFWVIKLDAIGALQWQKSFGGDHADEAYAVQQTMDGGYIVAGYTSSNKFDVSGNHGGSDYWIVRLDAAGNLVWQKALGGSKGEKAYDIRITSDSGYIVAGYSESSNGNVSANNGNKDYWIVKLDATGNLIWEKNYGGSKEDIATSIQPTADGGYVVAGSSKSSDGNVPANNGDEDFWMIRLDSLGNILWSKTYGGSGKDEAYALVVTDDGGYAIAGGSKSNDGDAAGNHGDSDFWIIRLDAAGTLLWQQMLGGNKNDKAFAMQQTSDGGFVLAGHADSHNNGDVTGHHGSSDFWVVKLAPDRICRPYTELHIVLCPGDSLLIGNTYQGNPGIYMDTLVSAIGCDSIVKITLTQNHCDDGDPCTEDFCVDGNCSYIPLVCNDNDPCTRDTCAGGCRFIPFEEEAGISQMPLPAFCQGDELILKAYPSDAQYFWSTGETTQTITAACGNTYSVTIINANGCQKTDTITTTSCQPHLLLSAHVIVAEREVRLQQNTVYSGGISVNGNYHKAKIEANSVITAPGTFVQADIIQVSGGSTVSIQIPDPAGIALPPFEFNAQCGTQGLHNISVPANSHVILNASVYKNITVGKNSSVTFTEPEINLENLFTQDNVQIHFTQPCVKMKLCKKLQLGKDNTFNPDYKDIMVYVEEDVTIHEGSTIIADIYMKEGKMTVKDAPANDPTVMQGLFIVHFLESGKHVHWYQNIGCPGICHPDITPVLCTANERAVVSFTLVSADDDVDLGPLQDGDTINLSVTGPINIRANVCHGDNIESVAFLVNGSFHRMENLPFYTIAGDNGGNYLPWNVSPGIYTIKAIPYSGNNGTGTMGTPNEITIVIIDGEELCADSDRKITSFTLVNADTDMDIGSLYDGAVIDLSTTGHINVRANVCHSDNVKSVQFFVNGSSYRIENAAPYALAGNSGPNYYIWPVTPGSYTIKAVPYSNFNAGGIAGSDKEVTITIAGSSPKRSDEPALTLQRVADEVEIKAYPNPFTEKLNIEFRLASDSEVKLDILSVDGRFITSVFDGAAKADMLYTFEFLPGNEPPGLLLYRLQTQKGIYYNKVLLVR